MGTPTPRRFRIYYGDGSTYSGDPFYAPPSNVQVIVMENPDRSNGQTLIMTKPRDFYLWRGGRWWACNEAGFYDLLMYEIGPKAVLFGRTIESDKYSAIVQRAKAEGFSDGQ